MDHLRFFKGDGRRRRRNSHDRNDESFYRCHLLKDVDGRGSHLQECDPITTDVIASTVLGLWLGNRGKVDSPLILKHCNEFQMSKSRFWKVKNRTEVQSHTLFGHGFLFPGHE